LANGPSGFASAIPFAKKRQMWNHPTVTIRADGKKLIKDLPAVLSELDGDIAWNRIISDTRTRPGLTALLDQVEADYEKNPAAYPEIKDKDFDLHS
jgi:hypothetical protein